MKKLGRSIAVLLFGFIHYSAQALTLSPAEVKDLRPIDADLHCKLAYGTASRLPTILELLQDAESRGMRLSDHPAMGHREIQILEGGWKTDFYYDPSRYQGADDLGRDVWILSSSVVPDPVTRRSVYAFVASTGKIVRMDRTSFRPSVALRCAVP